MCLRITLREISEGYRSLHRALSELRRKKKLRDVLKVLGIGFFIYKDVDKQITVNEQRIVASVKEVNETIIEFLENIQKEKDKLSNLDSYISKSQEEKLLTFLNESEKDFDYIGRAGVFEENKFKAILSKFSSAKCLA